MKTYKFVEAVADIFPVNSNLTTYQKNVEDELIDHPRLSRLYH
jgi:hypothetical protein